MRTMLKFVWLAVMIPQNLDTVEMSLGKDEGNVILQKITQAKLYSSESWKSYYKFSFCTKCGSDNVLDLFKAESSKPGVITLKDLEHLLQTCWKTFSSNALDRVYSKIKNKGEINLKLNKANIDSLIEQMGGYVNATSKLHPAERTKKLNEILVACKGPEQTMESRDSAIDIDPRDIEKGKGLSGRKEETNSGYTGSYKGLSAYKNNNN